MDLFASRPLCPEPKQTQAFCVRCGWVQPILRAVARWVRTLRYRRDLVFFAVYLVGSQESGS